MLHKVTNRQILLRAEMLSQIRAQSWHAQGCSSRSDCTATSSGSFSHCSVLNLVCSGSKAEMNSSEVSFPLTVCWYWPHLESKSRIGIRTFGDEKVGDQSAFPFNQSQLSVRTDMEYLTLTSVRVARNPTLRCGIRPQAMRQGRQNRRVVMSLAENFFTNQVSSRVLRHGQAIATERGHLRTSHWQCRRRRSRGGS